MINSIAEAGDDSAHGAALGAELRVIFKTPSQRVLAAKISPLLSESHIGELDTGHTWCLLLCEFARKKENPSLKRYIAPPSALSVVYFPLCTDPGSGCLSNDRKLLS